MRKTFGTLAVVAAAAGLVAMPVDARPRLSGEEELAKLLDGRTPGEAKDCIYTSPSSNLTIIDKTAIVYRQGKRLWINRTAHPEDLDDDDIMVIRRFDGGSLCRTDMITLTDRSSGMFTGAIFLSDFVPYEKGG